jgi:hypothetical protein
VAAVVIMMMMVVIIIISIIIAVIVVVAVAAAVASMNPVATVDIISIIVGHALLLSLRCVAINYNF